MFEEAKRFCIYQCYYRSVTSALKEEGFGVLTQIDVKATLKKKLDKDFRKYVILGACNPPYAFRSLEADLDVGLLLPCNVIVYETDNKKSYVSAVNPVSALGIIESERLRKIAEEVSEKLRKVIENLCNFSRLRGNDNFA
jgi:uncharacterized protein (DUF302 family)